MLTMWMARSRNSTTLALKIAGIPFTVLVCLNVIAGVLGTGFSPAIIVVIAFMCFVPAFILGRIVDAVKRVRNPR